MHVDEFGFILDQRVGNAADAWQHKRAIRGGKRHANNHHWIGRCSVRHSDRDVVTAMSTHTHTRRAV